jgi:hypothetical protein
MQVRSHERSPVCPPGRMARREGRGMPFSKNREPEVCGIDRFVVPLLIGINDIYLSCICSLGQITTLYDVLTCQSNSYALRWAMVDHIRQEPAWQIMRCNILVIVILLNMRYISCFDSKMQGSLPEQFHLILDTMRCSDDLHYHL